MIRPLREVDPQMIIVPEPRKKGRAYIVAPRPRLKGRKPVPRHKEKE